MKLLQSCVVLVALLSAAAVNAEGKIGIEEFLNFQKDVRASFAEGVPRELTKHEWELLDLAQGEIEQLLKGRRSIEALNRRQKARLLNAQERVNALLTNNEDDRLLCLPEHNVGTRLQQISCHTVADRREYRDAAQGALLGAPRSSGASPPSSGPAVGSGRPGGG